MSLDYCREEVTKSLPLWRLIDDLTDGYVGVVDGKNAKDYLPQSPRETDEAYKIRKQKAMLINPFNDTVEGMTGLIFKEPIVYNEDIPTILTPMIENATLQGDHMDLVIQEFFTLALRKGIAYALVDQPQGTATNRAEQQAQGIRPYTTIIQPENLTSWKTATVNGQLVLTQIKILEMVEENVQGNEYKTEMVKQYRVYEVNEQFTNTTLKVIRPSADTKGQDEIITQIETGLNFIPLVGLNLNKRGFFYALPPFYDIAKLNIGHYQLFTDARYAAHKASVPFYTAAGAREEEVKGLVISPNTIVRFDNPDASIGIVDYDGKGAEVSQNLMTKVETSIAQMGMNMLTADREVTATEAEIDNTKSQSKLNTFVTHLEESVKLIFLYAYRMTTEGADANEAGTITINADILTNPLTPEEMQKYSDMHSKQQITISVLYQILKDGGRLPDDFDIEAQKELVKEDGLLTNNENQN